MDRSTGSLTAGEQTWNNLVITLSILGKDLTAPVGWDTAHVVMHGGKDGNGLLGCIDTSEDMCSLQNTGETLMDLLGWKMVQVEVNVVILGTHTTTLQDLHGHRAGHDITRGQVLGSGRIALHEAFTLTVSEDTAFASAALSHQATSAVDSSRMELDKLGVFEWESSPSDHTAAITSACVSTSAREVGSAVATSGHNSLVSSHSVDSAIGHVVGHDSTALSTFHEQVHGKVFHEEDAVVSKSTTEKRVKHGVTGTVSHSSASVGLTALSEVGRLASKGSLVDLTLASSAERHTVGLELENSGGGLSGHVLDGILITKPVRSLHGIIEVELPVIVMHVSEGGIDSSLSSDGVRSGWEKLRDACSFESGLGQAEGSSKTSTTSADDDRVICMVNDSVVSDTALTLVRLLLAAR